MMAWYYIADDTDYTSADQEEKMAILTALVHYPHTRSQDSKFCKNVWIIHGG